MSSNHKIIVLKTREIIYTALLLFLAAVLIFCLVLMFSGEKKNSQDGISTESTASKGESTEETAAYTPGVYTAPVSLGSSTADVEVTVDSSHINSIRLINLSETAEAAFPLVSPSLEHIASQILEKQSLEHISCPSENRYTSQLLLTAVSDALSRARTLPGS